MKTEARGTVVRILISLSAIGVIIFIMRGKISETAVILKHEVRWEWVFVGIVTYVIANLILALRLRAVFQVQKIMMSVREVFHLTFVGLFFNLFLPSALGGDVAKGYYAYKHSQKKIGSTTAVILDRLIGFVVLIIMALVAVLIFSHEINDARVNQVIFVFMGIMLLTITFLGSKRFARKFMFLTVLIPSEKWKRRLSDIYHGINGYHHHWGILIFTLMASLVGQVLFILSYLWVTLSLSVEINPWIFFIIVPMISIISMAPSLGGLGVREAGAIYLFNRFMSPERALALVLLMDLLIYGVSIASGIFYSMHGGLKRKEFHEMEELR